MGTMELWLGAAGGGKTGEALTLLREELDRDWRAVRYLVPTVGHKRSLEHHFLEHSTRQGLFGDPVNIFFTFAQEVAQRGGVRGNRLTELQKHLLLKELIRTERLEYFHRAAQYPGFTQALGEAIDELKVHMVQSDDLLRASQKAEQRGFNEFACKLRELGTLYARYQQQLIAHGLFDNEGIMWLAAECLQQQANLCADLRCLVLDGFARLTPIQLHFVHALAPRIPRIIGLFDYEEGRSQTYHPVQASIDRLKAYEDAGEVKIHRRIFVRGHAPRTALETLRSEIFCDRRKTAPVDDSVALFVGATPLHETELIARTIRAILREGKLSDGTPIAPSEIAILARSAESQHERYERIFKRFGLTIRPIPPLIAHTTVGRALLAAFRLVRDQWKREDVLLLLKSGFLPVDPAIAFQIDLIARTHYLYDRRSTWFENWPDDATRDALNTALAPLAAFDTHYAQQHDAGALMLAVKALLSVFRETALADLPPLPDSASEAAQRYVELHAAFTQFDRLLDDLQHLESFLGKFSREDTLEVITTALRRETMPNPSAPSAGIPMLPVHATGGEKYKVVFLCDLLEGAFPRHQRESAFLMDHEREETLRDLDVLIEPRKHLEHDEQYWFIHSLSAATHRVILSYSQHESDGTQHERSSFLDEVERVLPDLATVREETQFRDVVPPLHKAESQEEFLAGLALGIRSERDDAARLNLSAAYAGCPVTHGEASRLAKLFQRAQQPEPVLQNTDILVNLNAPSHRYSASELQSFVDCPFVWFGSHCLRVEPVIEEFSPLDRGLILHSVLDRLYRSRQQHPGDPVHLDAYSLDELWPEVERDLREQLEEEPRYRNRAQFLRDIEWESLRRMMYRFLRNEIERAQTRKAHPAFFEVPFGSSGRQSLQVGTVANAIRGTIDRIDLLDDDLTQAIVIDYKTSSSMTTKDLISGKVLQAPVYLLAAERVFGMHPIGVEFLRLKQGDFNGIYRSEIQQVYTAPRAKSTLDTERWLAYLNQCESALCDTIEKIHTGTILLNPTTNRCSTSCQYYALCRGDKFTLERQLREAAKAAREPNEDGA